MRQKGVKFILILLLIVMVAVSLCLFNTFKKKPDMVKYGLDYEFQRRLSEEYLNQGLYEHAIESYERYLLDPDMPNTKRSNISYIIGNIYLENLADYKNALANFVRAKVFCNDNPNISDINKKIVLCLERLGRFADAERELSKATDINKKDVSSGPDKVKSQEIIVAKLGDRNITMSEIDAEIEKLPPHLRDMYKEKDKKKEFLNQYITGEILYDAAKRRNLDNDKEVIEELYNFKKQIMIERLLKEEVESKITEPLDADLRFYYEAHKDRYTEETKDSEGNPVKRQKTLEEVKDSVRREYLSEKRQELVSNFINNLAKAKDIELFEDAFEEKGK